MFEYLRGTLITATPHHLVVEVGGIGYRIMIPVSTFEQLPQNGTEVKVFVSPVIREDSHRLFGFLKQEERDLFAQLNEISGIGPRLSLAILGHLSIPDLYLAIEKGNTAAISKVPGIGKKMAERLVLELKDKFNQSLKTTISSPGQGVVADAINALIHLGYPPLEAQKAVKSALPEGTDPLLPELISMALKGKK